MNIATWNVNSIRARLPIVVEWLKVHQPDIIFLQETKCLEKDFPQDDFEDLGYNIVISGQKTFNGVATLSKKRFDHVVKTLPGFENDPQARYIETIIGGMYCINVYVPNGKALNSDHFAYKLAFFDALIHHLKTLLSYNTSIIIGGDFNVALTPSDVYVPITLNNTVCFSIPERQKLNQIINLGFLDALRLTTPIDPKQNGPFTWWDYRQNGFRSNKGMRLDYIFVSPNLVASLIKTSVDSTVRGYTKASDHAPVVCEFYSCFSQSP